MKTKTTTTEANRRRLQAWRAERKLHPGLCLCGRPAVALKHGNEPVCANCAQRQTFHSVRPDNRVRKLPPLKRTPNRTLGERMVDAFETHGRGWGSLDVLEKQLAELSIK